MVRKIKASFFQPPISISLYFYAIVPKHNEIKIARCTPDPQISIPVDFFVKSNDRIKTQRNLFLCVVDSLRPIA